MRSIEFTIVVLPVPGPPVMTRTFEERASSTAWLLAFGQHEFRFGGEPIDGPASVYPRPWQLSGGKRNDTPGDCFFGLIKPGEKDAVSAFDGYP